ncbi:hypothetical protein HDU76_004628, partial [Blyttiomyces sp. JEL0837]
MAPFKSLSIIPRNDPRSGLNIIPSSTATATNTNDSNSQSSSTSSTSTASDAGQSNTDVETGNVDSQPSSSSSAEQPTSEQTQQQQQEEVDDTHALHLREEYKSRGYKFVIDPHPGGTATLRG